RHRRQRGSAWPARHPLPQPLARAERPGLNWLPAQPALQIVSQSAGEEIPILGPFLQATQADGLQVAMEVRAEQMRLWRLTIDNSVEHLRHAVAFEWCPP